MPTSDDDLTAAPGAGRWRVPRSLLGALALGAVIRLAYLVGFPSAGGDALIGGDGLAYHLEANRIADGLGYTSAIGDIGAEIAHHPPGWVTVLAGFSWLGADSIVAHQVVATIVGLLLIVVTHRVASRLFDARVAAVAAFGAAVYPGFWVLEAQVLSEPLALVMLGLALLALHRFAEDARVATALLAGAAVGGAALVRSEQIALVAVVALLSLTTTGLSVRRRVVLPALSGLVVLVVLAPWAAYNATRFEEPVLLSSNSGTTLLAGNCSTFRGEWIGFYDVTCNVEVAWRERPADRSVMDRLARREALANIREHVSDLPLTIPARHGRMLGVLQPSQTVGAVAGWHGTHTWPVWTWVVSFWLLLPAAAIGLWTVRRRRRHLAALLTPIALVVVVVSVFFGEPRYHSPADLSILVLAAVGACAVVRRMRPGPEPLAATQG